MKAIQKYHGSNWLGHILWEEGENDCFTALGWTPEGWTTREAKDNLRKDGGEGKKQGGVEELRSSQSGGTEQGVLVGKRDSLMRLLARRDMMIMISPTDNLRYCNGKYDSDHC